MAMTNQRKTVISNPENQVPPHGLMLSYCDMDERLHVENLSSGLKPPTR